MISNECFLCSDPQIGLSINEVRTYVKCYMGDTGLLVSHAFDEKHRNDMEIDFLFSNNSKLKYKIYPIEVKSGTKYTMTSLTRFKEKFRNRIGECYIIHPKNLIVKDDIVCIPPYMAMLL